MQSGEKMMTEEKNDRIRLRETVIVEGKYDRIRLASLLDANIMELGGFRIYHNKERLALIRKIAEKTGIILLTDSDSAGFRIRHYLCSAVPKEQIKNVYIPGIFGKERRKSRPGKEGLLGVEGMTTETLLKAFAAAGITPEGEKERKPALSAARLYELGLSGGENSSALREKVCAYFELPKLLSSKALGEVLPILTDEEELREVLRKIREE